MGTKPQHNVKDLHANLTEMARVEEFPTVKDLSISKTWFPSSASFLLGWHLLGRFFTLGDRWCRRLTFSLAEVKSKVLILSVYFCYSDLS